MNRQEKTKQTLIAKYGSYELYKGHMKDISQKKRPNGGTGGFAKDRNLAVMAGRKSRRNKKVV